MYLCMYTNMYISTMLFGPVMSPRLAVMVRQLPGQFSNWTVLVFPGGLKNDRKFVRSVDVIRSFDIWNSVVGCSVCILCGRTIYIFAYVICTILVCTRKLRGPKRRKNMKIDFRASRSRLWCVTELIMFQTELIMSVSVSHVGGVWGLKRLVLHRSWRVWRTNLMWH